MTACGKPMPWKVYNSPQPGCTYKKGHTGRCSWDDPLTKQIYDRPMGMTD